MPSLARPAVAPGSLAGREQPLITAGALTLRPFALDDADAVVRAYADPAIQQWHVRTCDRTEALAWIRERAERWRAETGAEWAIVSDGVFVGRVRLRRMDLEAGVGEIAYWILPEHRGRRHAPAAVRRLSRWCFELGFGRLGIEHAVANRASCRVAEQAGFLLEGTRRHAGLHADGWHDMHLHGLTSISPEPCEPLEPRDDDVTD